MLKLIRLEWRKNHIFRYFKGIIIWIVAIFAAVALMGWGSKGQVEPMFPDYFEFMSLTNILIRIVFIIFSAVILSRLVIEEYRKDTIQLLFTYPVHRKKVMLTKLSIVFGFCFSSILLASIIINVLAFFLNPIIGFFEKPVRINDILATIPTVFLNAFMIAGISLIPLYFGMRKKSTATTITSGVIIGFLINATVSNGGSQTSLFQFIGVPIIFCLIGLTIGYISFHKLDKMDVI
ncbi:bacitracin ABC transporter permease [Bacillus sp. 7586-K]|uniref:ABC transporter permease n=1 Tax=Metabacillus niabensis TaxID=324854 RepID=UPI000BA55FF1|nr:bacitracin ABC transporter permease [Bacillus sp. 7586-K]